MMLLPLDHCPVKTSPPSTAATKAAHSASLLANSGFVCMIF